MPIGLTDYIIPKNEAFVGIVRAQDVKGSGDAGGTLPVSCYGIVSVGDADDTESPSAYVGVGDDTDGMLYALAAGKVYLDNRTVDADLIFAINDNGTRKEALTITGANGIVTLINHLKFAASNDGILDPSGNEILIFQAVTDATDYIKLINGTNVNPPAFYALGSTTDIDIFFFPRNAGVFRIGGSAPGIVADDTLTPNANLYLAGAGTGVVYANGSPVVVDDDFASNGLLERTAAGVYAVTTITAAGKAILDDDDAAAQRTTLGLGTMALEAATAFLRLLGISGGQTAYGGTDSGDDLKLKSTSHATKGTVEIGDEGDTIIGATGQSSVTMVMPSVDEIIDLGTDALRFRNLYATRPHLPGSTGTFSNPPTDSELDSAFGTPPTLGDNFFGIINPDGDDDEVRQVCVSNGKWFYGPIMTEAV